MAGSTSTPRGRSAICRRSATSTSGPMASISRRASKTKSNASLCWSARRRRGRKELVGFSDGARESAHDWRDLLLDLKRRGLDAPPRLVIADGALGFWKAAGEVWPKTREQRCWVHKTANVLAKMPKSQQPKAKRALQEIWMAETKVAAELAFDAFIESYALKYDKAADCLAKDRDTLLAQFGPRTVGAVPS